MPFRVKKTDTPGQAVKRACREGIGEARSRLRHPHRPTAIHGARRDIKKLRALFQLVRGEISRGVYRRGIKALRGAAEQLAATRDARVMLKAFESLAGGEAEKFPAVRAALEKNARREARGFCKKEAPVRAEKFLRKAGRRVAEMRIKTAGWEAFERGLRGCYRRGREACALAGRAPEPGHFHAWRRHVKRLWYCLCQLRPAWKTSTRLRVDALKLLGQQLGEEHDLCLLDGFVRKHVLTKEGDGLNDLIANRRQRLQAAALKLGARVYAEEPPAFCRRLRRQWDAWRASAGAKRGCGDFTYFT
jgi:CHAD domain-containing protein